MGSPLIQAYTATLSSDSTAGQSSNNLRNGLGVIPDNITIIAVLASNGNQATANLSAIPTVWLSASPTSATGGISAVCQRTGTTARVCLMAFHSILDASVGAW